MVLDLCRKYDMAGLKEFQVYIENKLQQHDCLDVAEVASLVTANIYMISLTKTKQRLPEEFDKLKSYNKSYSDSKKVKSAYISVCKEEYLATSSFRKVPDKILSDAKELSLKYSDEIEFPEAYFGLLMAKLEYAQEHDQRNEQKRLFREMKEVADRTDYSEYHEENNMKPAIDMLQMFYGY